MKRLLLSLVVVVALAGLLAAGLVLGIGHYLSPQDPLINSDAIVAISGGDTAARANEAIKLYHEGYAPTLIFSGAALDENGPSNAMTMERLAVAQGVEASHILIDETSQNTTENATNVAALAQAHHYHQIILVTSPFHQRRAFTAFHHALGSGVTIINHSAPDPSWTPGGWWRSPRNIGITASELQKTLFQSVWEHF